MICAEIRFRWKYVATRVAYFDRFRGMDTSGLPIFMEFRCILFWDTSESDVLGASRCIWNTWFYAHTSEMPDLEPSRCTEALVSVGDTSGLRVQCPSRCTGVQIYLQNTSGWTNIDYFRCIAKYHHSEIHRNPAIHSHPDVSQLISREYTYLPLAVYPRASMKNKQNTSEFQVFTQSRCISINFPRVYLFAFAAYPRASRLQFDFPRKQASL